MGFSWDFNGIFMGFSWDFNGILMGFSWDFNGILGHPYYSHYISQLIIAACNPC
jgi:hypothetical protein